MTKINHYLCLGLIGLIGCLCPLMINAQNNGITGDVANWVTDDSRPGWMEIKQGTNFDPKAFINLLNDGNSFTEGSSFDLDNSSKNKQGQTRHVYQQYYKGIPIDNYIWVLHETEGRVALAQGQFYNAPDNPDPQPILQGEQALIRALDTARAIKYAWETPALETYLQVFKGDTAATYYPQAKLVWVEGGDDEKLELAYKFDIYSVDPIARKNYYINAKTGQLIRSIDVLNTGCFGDHGEHLLHPNESYPSSDSRTTNTGSSTNIGTGIANYITTNGGIVNIPTTFNDPDYTLINSELGPLGTQTIQTVNANNYWNYENLSDFTDTDNYWDHDPIAIGAHWGAEQVYNYYLDTFNRNSFDNAGADVISVVHYGEDLVNAYWNGVTMTYGDGNGNTWDALSSLDIIAHEFTHGVTEYNGTGGLIYLDESGALNESFSDIFGTVVEFLYHPDGGDWLVGEDFDLAHQNGFRNMENPNLMNHPKTYLGLHWFDGAGDNGGVHINSSVQNYWFYLLANGGSGTNEFGHTYDISPIGMDKAANIAYYNLTHFLLPNSTYQDAKDGAINSALILYPNDQSVQDAVVDAWCAVGLGAGCGPIITVDNPVANEVITAGSDYEVAWTTSLIPATSKVKIEYTTEEGNNPAWQFIAENIDNTGTYAWNVPSDYSGTVRLRIIDDGDPTTGRVSNSDILGISPTFQIEACIATNSFTAPTTTGIGEIVQFTGNIAGTVFQWKIDGQEVATTKNWAQSFTEAGIYEVTYTVENTATNCFNEETKRLYVLEGNSNGFAIQVGDVANEGGRAYGQEIIQTNDGGYIFVSLFTAIVFKIDALGELVWKTTALPSPAYPNYRLAGIEKSDGTLLIVMGRSESGGSTSDDNLLLVEVDGTDGTIINGLGKQLSTNGRLLPHQIIATDTSYIIGGEYEINNERDVFLLELKATDYSITKQIWIGDDNRQDYYGHLTPTADGGFMMGWIQSGAFPEYFGVIKLDGNLQEEWREGLSSNYARPGSRSRMRILEVPDCGGYLILGNSDEYANTTLININVLGNVLWAKRYNTPDYFDGQLISFQDMVWDGKDGVTLLGVNGTKLNSNNYPDAVDYQLLNVGFDGEMNWKRKVTDLQVKIPTDPGYNLYVTKLLLAADGGYLAMIPGSVGDETHLIKADALGMDGCVMTNTNINEADISISFNVTLGINRTLAAPPVIQTSTDYPFNISIPVVNVTAPKCGNITGGEVIAAYCAENYTLLTNNAPVITNLSRGATAYTWKLDGNPVSFPIPNFTNVGVYALTLEATDGANTSSVTYHFNVVEEVGCQLPCDLALVRAYTIPSTCPDSEDAQIYSEVTSPIGRTFKYELYDDHSVLIKSQPTGFFTGLATGSYQIKVVSINDEACLLDLGNFDLSPKVDITPPRAVCQSAAVDVAFVHAAIGVPYNHLNYVNEMTAAIGQDWHELTYETVDPQKLFSDSYNYIYLEGSDNNANELETFLGTNQQLIEDWVAAGNALFLNAGPNEGDGMNVGFGGVQLVRGTYDTAFVKAPDMPVFTDYLATINTKFGGYPYSLAAVICPAGMDTTKILTSKNGTDLLVQATWGNGKILLGGMNLTGFHTPSSETYNFKINLHHYLKSLPIATVNSPIQITLDESQLYSLPVNEIDLGSFDDCGLSSIELAISELDCEDIGVLDIALIATDVANNVATCTTKVEIINGQTEIKDTICQGADYLFNNQNLITTGIYRDTLLNANACDSILILTLTLKACEDGICIEDNALMDDSPIQKGYYKAAISITSAGQLATDTVIYQAGDFILLEPGFEAVSGSEFVAKIVENTCSEPAIIVAESREAVPPNQLLSESKPINTKHNELLVSPNPFLNQTKIDFQIGIAQEVRLAIYSIDGQLIQVLQDGYLSSGKHTKSFMANHRNRGIYLVVLQTEKEVLTKKIIRLE